MYRPACCSFDDEYIQPKEIIVHQPTKSEFKRMAMQLGYEPVRHGHWINPTVIDGRAFNIPHCSICNEVPCGVDEHTNYCPNCGAKMNEVTK